MSAFRPLSAEQQAMLQANPNPTLVLDSAFRIRFINAAAAAVGQVSAESLVGELIWSRYPELEHSVFHKAYAAVLAERTPQRFEEYREPTDRWVSVYAYPADGGVVAVLEDISERRRAERALRESQQALARAGETLRIAQEAANIGSFERDLATGRTHYSPQLMRILGIDPATYDPERPGNRLRSDFVHPDDVETFNASFRRVVGAGKLEPIRVRAVRRDGAIRHVIMNAIIVRDADGAPVRVVGTALDVSEQVAADEERARLEAQMQQAQKLESLGVLAGGIAHDFNNLLVGILGNASLALLDIEDPEARRSVEEIEHAAQRAAELTRQLLAYAGKGRFVVETVDPSAIVHEMSALLRTAVSKGATTRLALREGLPSIEADSTQLRQVVMNLITNASDAIGDEPGVITLSTGVARLDADALLRCVPGTHAAPGEFVVIEVRDTGIGMDEATRARIFDPFYSTKFTGRGLGLAATLGIMRGHRGAIEVKSAVGEGTTVRLFFPVSGRRAAESPVAAAPSWTGHGRVLLADDEESVRAVGSALLRRRGFEVHAVADGNEAVEAVRTAPGAYTLVLLDLTMPGLGGDAAFETIRTIDPELRVILMSGYNEHEVTRMFEGRGIAGFLQKPFGAEQMYDLVGRVSSRGDA